MIHDSTKPASTPLNLRMMVDFRAFLEHQRLFFEIYYKQKISQVWKKNQLCNFSLVDKWVTRQEINSLWLKVMTCMLKIQFFLLLWIWILVFFAYETFFVWGNKSFYKHVAKISVINSTAWVLDLLSCGGKKKSNRIGF